MLRTHAAPMLRQTRTPTTHARRNAPLHHNDSATFAKRAIDLSGSSGSKSLATVSYTHLRAHETSAHL
eukprot:2616805-Alexandrium_andersonii.AAC.1